MPTAIFPDRRAANNAAPGIAAIRRAAELARTTAQRIVVALQAR